MRKLLRRKVTWVVLAIAAVLLAGGLWAFQPWKLLTHSTVDEALPADFAPTSAPMTSGPMTSVPMTSAPMTSESMMTTANAGPRELAVGAFVSQEHKTTGTARVLEQNGVRLLRLEGLSSSDGPDLHVWLSEAKAGGDWHAADDGRYIELGKLKATDGNQNYAIPADADLAGLNSVVIWCDRFNVAFGSAPLSL